LTATITSVLGISIPVIVRSGETSARVSIAKVVRVPVPDRPDLLNIDVRLESVGNRSAFVDLRILSTRQRRGDAIFLSKAVSIYSPVNARNLTLSLTAQQTARLKAGSAVLQYQEVNQDGVPIGPNAEVAL
jgi:hypothetical protein